MVFFRDNLCYFREGGNPLLQIVYRITVCIRVTACTTVASMDAGVKLAGTHSRRVEQVDARRQTCLFASLVTERDKVYG